MQRRSRSTVPELPGLLGADDIRETAASIAAVQESSGAIPWFPGGHTDPWDHVESAMALAVGGLVEPAVAAYRYLARTQRRDGSWPSRVRGTVVQEPRGETNHAAYVAVGVWHQLLLTGDIDFAVEMWPVVRRAVDMVCAAATERGEIRWAIDPDGTIQDLVLLTGSSSINQSLRCALALAERLDQPQPEWELAAGRLAHVIAEHQDVFADKQRFSMDWYYPVLGGAVRGATGRRRIAERWDDFVVPGLGARCVDDEPWITGAESAELVIALDCLGDRSRAMTMLAEVQHLRAADGSYWTGWQFVNGVNWPDEHSTWTAAAMILATDVLSGATAGSGIFRGDDLPIGVDLDDSACGCDLRVSGEAGAATRPRAPR